MCWTFVRRYCCYFCKNKKQKSTVDETEPKKKSSKSRKVQQNINAGVLEIKQFDHSSKIVDKSKSKKNPKTLSQIPDSQLFKRISLPDNQCNDPYDYLKKLNYKLTDQLLGKGGYGSVYKAQYVFGDTNKEIACKIIQVSGKKALKAFKALRNELYTLQNVRHEHIVRLYDHFLFNWNVTTGDKSTKMTKAYLFMEYADQGTLERQLALNGPIVNDEAQRYFGQIVTAVAHMHKQQLAHRDLKLENFLLFSSKEKSGLKHVKVSDFGMSLMAYKQDKGYVKISDFGGTRQYMAPEIIKLRIFRRLVDKTHLQYLPFKADMWALGVCLYRMLTTQFPFEVPHSKREPFNQLLRDQEACNWKLPKHIDKDADDLIHRLLEPDCDKRIEMFGVIAHPWLEQETSLTTDS